MTTLVCAIAAIASAQSTQRATAASPFHKDPRGIQLGTLVADARYRTGATQGTWIEATVEGWIWTASVTATSRDGFDLVVSSTGGEVVRAAPNGAVVARLVEGTLLTRAGSQRGWTRVRRTGWVSRNALAAAPAGGSPATPAAAPSTPPPAPAPSPAAPAVAGAADSAQSRVPAADPPATARAALRQGTEVAAGPDGAAIATLDAPAEAEIVERSRDWVKVRLEGWVRAADLAGQAEPPPAITGAMLRQQPDRYVGQPVTWRLHFLAVQEADELRPEMPRGQRYLLTRGPLPESGFVYLMVSREQAARLEGLRPLDEVRIEGVIRAGRTRFLPTPVVELTRVVEGR